VYCIWKKERPQALQLPKYPRLADFAEICEIISRCIGNPEMAFIEAYYRNINSRHRRIVNDSAVGRSIEIFIERKNNEWSGVMSDLLSELRDIASTDLKLMSVKNSIYWPQTPAVLSRKINEIKDSLRAIGIEIDNKSGDTSEREYIIKKKILTPPVKKVTKYALGALASLASVIFSDDNTARR
jgi:hypothetical protein